MSFKFKVLSLAAVCLWAFLDISAITPIIFTNRSSGSGTNTVPLFAHSVRQLYGWTGYCCKISADPSFTDPAEGRNIELVGGWANTNAVMEYASTNSFGNTVFVEILYDNTGNTNHAYSTHGSDPSDTNYVSAIVVDGVLVTHNGKPALMTYGPYATFNIIADPLNTPLGVQMSNSTFTAYFVGSTTATGGYQTVLYGAHMVVYGYLDAVAEWGTYNDAVIEADASSALWNMYLLISKAPDNVFFYTGNSALVNKTNGTAYNYRGDEAVYMFSQDVYTNPWQGLWQESAYWTNSFSTAAEINALKTSVNNAYNLW